MPSASKKSRLRGLIAARGWLSIGEAEWEAALREIPNLSTSDMKHAGIAVAAPWSGVAQGTLQELEASLLGMSGIYAARHDLRRFSRTQVIRAKDRARLASHNRRMSDEKRLLKAEMVEWMLVWLGDPAMFPAWVSARRRVTDGKIAEPTTAKVVK